MQNVNLEQEVIDLSQEKWRWMSERKVDSLDALFHEKAVFVHMGGSWGKEQELEVIKSGGIHYKNADIHEVSVNIIGATAILLNRITLLAVVGGNEDTNPFRHRCILCHHSQFHFSTRSLVPLHLSHGLFQWCFCLSGIRGTARQ